MTKKNTNEIKRLLVTFRNFAKSDSKFRHVCPSGRMEQLESQWTDLY
jgi:hypothetical protein